MRTLLPVLALAAWAPAQAQDIHLPPGTVLEARVDADLNGDGIGDTAYLAGNEDSRALTVLLSEKGEAHIEHRAEVLLLDPFPLGPGSLSLDGNVLALEDLNGGTTAIASTHRFRYDPALGHLRLIGLDATLYSRTYAHDGFEVSWNVLTGDVIARELQLNEGGGDAAYGPIVETKSKRRVQAVPLSESPSPEDVIAELSGD